MTCDPNDPRLTAFVLGELDPSECADIETMLGESADCRQAVDEIRLTVGWLTSRLHDEIESHAQPAEVNHRTLVANVSYASRPGSPWWHRNRFRFLGIAASLLLFAPVAYLTLMPRARMAQELPKPLAVGSTPIVARSVTNSPQVAIRSEPSVSYAATDQAAIANGASASAYGTQGSLPRYANYKQAAPASEPLARNFRYGKRVDIAAESAASSGKPDTEHMSLAQNELPPLARPRTTNDAEQSAQLASAGPAPAQNRNPMQQSQQFASATNRRGARARIKR
jgi:hypothetical protein